MFGAYLLVAAAVAFVVWLVRVVAKPRETPVGTTPETVPAAAPEATYSPLALVEPRAFDDPSLLRATVSRLFSSWIKRIPSTPTDGTDLIQQVDVRTRLVGRLVTELEGRRLAWRTVPFSGRGAVGGPPIDPSSLDPWNPPADLKATSRYVASCWTCEGTGRVGCTTCGVSGRTICESCSGSGKYNGTTASGAERLLNCRNCRGKGDQACTECTRGLVTCPTCHKLKKLDCWLEVDESKRQDTQVEPDGDVTKAFPWGQDGTEASLEELALDTKVVDSATKLGRLDYADVSSPKSAAWLTEHWANIQPKIEPGEEVCAQTFTLLEVPSTEITLPRRV
jgi:hypothetical protein